MLLLGDLLLSLSCFCPVSVCWIHHCRSDFFIRSHCLCIEGTLPRWDNHLPTVHGTDDLRAIFLWERLLHQSTHQCVLSFRCLPKGHLRHVLGSSLSLPPASSVSSMPRARTGPSSMPHSRTSGPCIVFVDTWEGDTETLECTHACWTCRFSRSWQLGPTNHR